MDQRRHLERFSKSRIAKELIDSPIDAPARDRVKSAPPVLNGVLTGNLR